MVKYCWNCSTGPQKFKCSSCGIAQYCSEICQKEHWKVLHKNHCKYLSGKKILTGSIHSQETCETCQKVKESRDSKGNFRRREHPIPPPGTIHSEDTCEFCQMEESRESKNIPVQIEHPMKCHLWCCDEYIDRFTLFFVATRKYEMDVEKAENERNNWKNVGLPFEFGEISGPDKYLDFYDEALGYLSTLLVYLNYRYESMPSVGQNLNLLLDQIIKLRAHHWAVSLIFKETDTRIKRSSSMFNELNNSEKVLKLHEAIGKIEDQHDETTPWHSFLFLYEMLGISSCISWILSIEEDSIDESDTMSFTSGTWFGYDRYKILGEDISIHTDSIFYQISLLQDQMRSLSIFDDNFYLKPFHEIYKQFLRQFGFRNFNQTFSCELCKTPVNYIKCDYVFHSLHQLDSQWLSYQKERNPELLPKSNTSQIRPGQPYVTYNIGSGLRFICNSGGCKNIYNPHVCFYRRMMTTRVFNLMEKYSVKLFNYECWVCNRYSVKSHRCSNCQSRLYCSPACQSKDWKFHQTICNGLKEAGTQIKGCSQARRDCEDLMKQFKEGVKIKSDCGRENYALKQKQSVNSVEEVD